MPDHPAALLRCPFCNNSAFIESANGLAFYGVCQTKFCAAVGPERCEADAISAWNRRASSTIKGTLDGLVVREKSFEQWLDELPVFASIVSNSKLKGASDKELQAWAWGIEDATERLKGLIAPVLAVLRDLK